MSRPPRVTVSVPATSANLGPGFDAFAIALDLRDSFTAKLAYEWVVDVLGEGEGVLACDERNLVAVAARRVFDVVGHRGAAHIRCENRIPVGKGLGSSAAAIVGGLLLADGLTGAGLSVRELLQLASEIEGHADNAAAALLGGFVVARRDAGGFTAERFEPAVGLAVVAALSERELRTAEARRVLPATVPHADAAGNAARAALFALGVVIGRRELVRAGAEDFLHERYRSVLIPDWEETRAALLSVGADAAVLSGAGPTVLGIFTGPDDADALERARDAASAVEMPPGRRALVVSGDRRGATVDAAH